MIDRKAYNSISYSISIVGSLQDGKYRGCVVNSLQQLTSSSPAKFAVTLNKYNLTEAAVEQTGAFCTTVAAADCPHDIINLFGYKSGRITDKFAAYDTKTDDTGCPYITDGMCARLSFRVVQQVELDSAVLFIAEVTEAEILKDGGALTVDAFKTQAKRCRPTRRFTARWMSTTATAARSAATCTSRTPCRMTSAVLCASSPQVSLKSCKHSNFYFPASADAKRLPLGSLLREEFYNEYRI